MTFVDKLLQFIELKPLERAEPPDLSVAQRNFLVLHASHLVERWQWHFLGTQLRAHAGRRKATIWCDDLDDLLSRGLMEGGHGCADVRITSEGRQRIAS